MTPQNEMEPTACLSLSVWVSILHTPENDSPRKTRRIESCRHNVRKPWLPLGVQDLLQSQFGLKRVNTKGLPEMLGCLLIQIENPKRVTDLLSHGNFLDLYSTQEAGDPTTNTKSSNWIIRSHTEAIRSDCGSSFVKK